MPRLTEQQHAERARGLGASDVAVLTGTSPFATPFELYLQKIGELDPDARMTDATRGVLERGHRLEGLALQWEADISGEPVERVHRTVWHPRLPFMFCHPDGRRRPWRVTRRLVEVKTSSRRWTEVPPHVQAQVQAQMACTGAVAVDVVVLTFDGAPERFTVLRDDELIGALEELATAFWDRVQRRDPPPLDGSDGAARWLNRLPFREEPEIPADDDQRRVIARLIELRRQADELAREDALLVNVLKMSMAGASRLNARGIGRVVWTAPVTRRTVRWREVAEEVRRDFGVEDEAWVDITDRHATVDEGVRTFRLTPDEEGTR